MEPVVVVIPIYRDLSDKFETASFKQCLSVLGHYPIRIVCHRNVKTDRLSSVFQSFPQVNVAFEYFEESNFRGVEGYNRLCLSYDFYKRFEDYAYMLIYQLDAWVFKDELLQWCQEGYDYVGAPWPKSYGHTGQNGGLSLRRVKAFTRLFEQNPRYLSIQQLLDQTSWKSFKSMLKLIGKLLGIGNSFKSIHDYSLRKMTNEDVFWTVVLHGSLLEMKMPAYRTAIQFAFEVDCMNLYIDNDYQLPFGCHAFQKTEWDLFWKNHINIS